jgi:alcohol dehydrogenase YqhD (iron-dependent ADH family)
LRNLLIAHDAYHVTHHNVIAVYYVIHAYCTSVSIPHIALGSYDSKEAMQAMIKDVEEFETKDESEKANRYAS